MQRALRSDRIHDDVPRGGTPAALALLVVLGLTGCSDRSPPWEAEEARATQSAIAAERAERAAAVANEASNPTGATVKPARGPVLPVAAMPEILRASAAPARRPAGERAPRVVAPPRPPESKRSAPPSDQPSVPAKKSAKALPKPPAKPSAAKPAKVDLGDPYGSLDWSDAIALVQSPSVEDRRVGARLLGLLGLTADQIRLTRELLEEARTDADPGVRKAAQQALEKVGK